MREITAAVLVTVLAVAGAGAAGTVTGKWAGSVETPNGPFEVTFDFKAEGETLTGTVTSAMGTVDLSNGKVEGDTLRFDVQTEGGTIQHEATMNAEGTEIAIKATGDWGVAEYVVKRVPTP